jgi:hypothetical protein
LKKPFVGDRSASSRTRFLVVGGRFFILTINVFFGAHYIVLLDQTRFYFPPLLITALLRKRINPLKQ